MKLRSHLFIIGLFILVFGCTAEQAQVKTNYDKSIDFSSYNTYKILENAYQGTDSPATPDESQVFVAIGIIGDNWKEEKQEIKQAIINMFADFPPESPPTKFSSNR